MNSAGINFRQASGIEWVALIAACLLSMLLVTYPIFDFDFFWHLANGREMVNSSHIISKEVFSYTHPGEHFANHEWLAQIFFYKVWHAFGPTGLFTLKLFIVCMMAGLLFFTLRNIGQTPVISALLTVLVVLAGLNRYHIRPELFTLFDIALLGFILHSYCAQRVPRMLLWLIPVIMVLWDWLHGAIYGFAFLTMFVVAENVKYRVNWFQYQLQLSRSELRYLNLCFVVSVVAMLINPFGLRSYSIFIGYVTGEANFNSVITEFTPVSWEFSKVFILMFVWLIILTIRNWRQLDITKLLLAMVFGLAAMRFSRMEGAAAIVIAPAIAHLLGLSMQATRNKIERQFHAVSLTVIGVLVLANGYAIKFIPDEPEADSDEYHYVKVYDLSFGYRMDEDFYPVGAVNFIQANNLTGHLYNSGNLGGYLSYYITPKRKIFQYNMGRVFGDPLEYARHPEKLAKWNVNYALVDTDSEMILFPDSEWATVYHDEASLLLVRRTPENEALIYRYEINYFNPVYSAASLLKQAEDPGVLPILASEMGDYLSYRRDPRISAVWARILNSDKRLISNQHIQELLGKVLKYNPDSNLQQLIKHA